RSGLDAAAPGRARLPIRLRSAVRLPAFRGESAARAPRELAAVALLVVLPGRRQPALPGGAGLPLLRAPPGERPDGRQLPRGGGRHDEPPLPAGRVPAHDLRELP